MCYLLQFSNNKSELLHYLTQLSYKVIYNKKPYISKIQ